MNTTIGTCSLCGGRVSVPTQWAATAPPIPTCESCGAMPRDRYGPKVEMDPATRQPRDEVPAFGELHDGWRSSRTDGR